jgi:hypothetical protein
MKLKLFLTRIAMWQPKPYIAFTNAGEPMSWWFYNNCFPDGYDDGTECNVYEASLLGEIWHHFFFFLIMGGFVWRSKHFYHTLKFRLTERKTR